MYGVLNKSGDGFHELIESPRDVRLPDWRPKKAPALVSRQALQNASNDDLGRWGMVRVSDNLPAYDNQTQQLTNIRPENPQGQWQRVADVVALPDEVITANLESAKTTEQQRVLDAYDQAFARLVHSPQILAEYRETEAQALTFQEGGYVGDPPAMVAAGMVTSGRTAQAECDVILAKATALRAANEAMRTARFSAEAAISAVTAPGEVQAAGQPFIDELNAIALIEGA